MSFLFKLEDGSGYFSLEGGGRFLLETDPPVQPVLPANHPRTSSITGDQLTRRWEGQKSRSSDYNMPRGRKFYQ